MKAQQVTIYMNLPIQGSNPLYNIVCASDAVIGPISKHVYMRNKLHKVQSHS